MVHLRSIRLRGFKTFAKPTELIFEPGVTVIIGPNGSGKSNIADAVLWVLGEQSPTNVRGRSMQDVIFTGPGGRRSSAVAEVSLIFDNNGTGSLPFDWQELEVTRRLTRDSGSEYRVNGSGCRLLDVQDMVGALGLGREMHSVVSQGKVEAFLNSTPEARRAMVEEAAGLGRFKKRRERAEAKLERTRQNLQRVADIEREVKGALRPLRQQVAAAERLAKATEEWALARGRLLMGAIVGVRAESANIQEALSEAESRRREIEEEQTKLREQRTAEEQSFGSALEARERLGALYHQSRAVAGHLESGAVGLRQRLAKIEGELDRTRRRYELAEVEAASLTARVNEALAASPDDIRLAKVSEWGEGLRKALGESLPAYRSAGADEDQLKDSVFELESARSKTLQDRDFLRREVEERSRVGTELAELVAEAAARLERIEGEASALETAVSAARSAVRTAEDELREAATQREEARALADEALRAEASLGEILAGVEARQAVLEDVLARKEAVSSGVRELLKEESGCRSLTEVLRVEPGYERALAAALGPLIQAVVVPEAWDIVQALQAEGPLEAVRALAAAAPTEPKEAPPAETQDLWAMVSGPEGVVEALRKLIGPTAVLMDDDSLYGWLDEDGPKGRTTWRLVSRSGEVLQSGFHAARRQELGAEAPLKARNELEAASKERETLLADRRRAREEVDSASLQVTAAETQYREREERLHQLSRQLTALTGDHDLQVRRLEEARLQRAELEGRTEREAGLVDQMLADLRTAEEDIAATETELERVRASLRRHQAEVESLRRTVDGLEAKKSQAALVEVRLRERCRSQENEKVRVLSQRDAAMLQTSRLKRRVEALERYLPAVVELLATASRLAERANEAAATFGSMVDASRTDADGVARSMRDWGTVETGLQRELDTLVAHSTELQVDQALLGDRMRSLEGELADLQKRHMSPRGLTAEDVVGIDASVLEGAVERAERRRERIGPVNPLAEQECSEMEERARFLEEQRRDLEASMSQLGDVIRDLDEHIERVFEEIFGATRENFSSVIASVFPGAKGTLRLTEARATAATPDDEDTEDEQAAAPQPGGIAVEVKLPNKSPRSLSLLSGGEKAMAAIAFLFSMFLARPCPFYILDEVEASLDDINIRRFLTLIRKYRERTQFIIITHQRQTMEVADTLYGVALESDGTSRVLSRRLVVAKGA